jgi:hypothetical protein
MYRKNRTRHAARCDFLRLALLMGLCLAGTACDNLTPEDVMAAAATQLCRSQRNCDIH